MRKRLSVLFCLLIAGLGTFQGAQPEHPWKFVVSGDSRNCGDVVMPAIAKGAFAQKAAFYWHLGDFRAISRVDQDYWETHRPADPSAVNIENYLENAWQDFIENQLQAFGRIPVYLAFGNHELIPPKTREELIATFADWLDQQPIREQRLRDNPNDHEVRGYYHWQRDGIDFITLDNASREQFDRRQLKWIKALLTRDAADDTIRALVVGMHEALPDSLAGHHSMDDSTEAKVSGREVYEALLKLKAASAKPVYVLASHGHYYMEGVFNTPYWQEHGGELPGWIIGTAGAERIALPAGAQAAKAAKAHVYGYLVASVGRDKDDPVHFEFKQLEVSDVPAEVMAQYTPEFVKTCWEDNPPVK